MYSSGDAISPLTSSESTITRNMRPILVFDTFDTAHISTYIVYVIIYVIKFINNILVCSSKLYSKIIIKFI